MCYFELKISDEQFFSVIRELLDLNKIFLHCFDEIVKFHWLDYFLNECTFREQILKTIYFDE